MDRQAWKDLPCMHAVAMVHSSSEHHAFQSFQQSSAFFSREHLPLQLVHGWDQHMAFRADNRQLVHGNILSLLLMFPAGMHLILWAMTQPQE